jgi:hypothetical protein
MNAATRRSLLVAMTALTIGLAPGIAPAVEQARYSMEILVDGMPLTEYWARNTSYVEARHGAEYSVRLTNRSGERIAIALAIDGLNSVDAKTTTALAARKWVLDPWETVTIDGWQTDAAFARRFFFTTEESSYAKWLGRTTNLGVIEAVVFRERPPAPVIDSYAEGAPQGRSSTAERGAAPQAAPESRKRGEAGEKCRPSDDYAATGIGRQIHNRVQRVSFDTDPTPAARLRIRYEYRPQLIRLGVLPQPRDWNRLDRREHASGFTDSDFCPDPYDHR